MKALKIALVCLATCDVASAQFGRKKRNLRDDDDDNARAAREVGTGAAAVDLAMQGWEQLGSQPEKLQELLDSMKDPEVVAKAKEMLNDPEYVQAAKAKLAALEGKAKAKGLLNADGTPASREEREAREWELENARKYQEGALNDAQLGMANLKGAINDPSVMQDVFKMMNDPETMAEVRNMMNNPDFKRQAAEMMKGVDMSKMQQAMQAAAQRMGGAQDPMAEYQRMLRENQGMRMGA